MKSVGPADPTEYREGPQRLISEVLGATAAGRKVIQQAAAASKKKRSSEKNRSKLY